MARKAMWLAAPALGVNILWLAMPAPSQKTDYAGQVFPILKAHCLSCHSGDKPAGQLVFTPTSTFTTAQANEIVVRVKGLGGKQRMPLGFAPLDSKQIGIIESWVAEGAKTQAGPTFNQDILPIFKAHCISCHAGESPKGDLSLFDWDKLRKSEAIILGNPDKSPLYRRVMGLDGLDQMPIGFAPLAPSQIETIKQWIKNGAPRGTEVPKHWAYVSPKLPALPKTKNTTWAKNPIDSFVLEMLEKKNLTPSKAAPKEILIRRVSLDIIGLPPTPKEVAAFLNDKRPDAYERLVERLLASPHYGERLARPWLDLSRYADTNGFEKDGMRTAWKYRDWLIQAFNKNMPYDQFVIEQIAGDLIPAATLDQRIATGFERNSMLNLEGGVDQREAIYDVINERVGTTSTVFLGSTLACARCHDHKFDPFSQKDFFRMTAFFNNTRIVKTGNANISEEKWSEPEIQAPSPEQTAQLKKLETKLQGLNQKLKEGQKTNPESFQKWKEIAKSAPKWSLLNPKKLSSASGTLLQVKGDTIFASGPNPATEVFTLEFSADQNIRAIKIEPVSDGEMSVGRGSTGNFVLTGTVLEANKKAIKIGDVFADFTQDGYNVRRLPKSDTASGWAVYPQAKQSHSLILELEQPANAQEVLTLKLEFKSPWAQHSFSAFKISASDSDFAGAELYPSAIKTALKDNNTKELENFYAGIAPETKAVRQEADQTTQEIAKLKQEIPTALVLEELPAKGPLTAFLHHRGEFLNPTEKVTANTPEILPPLPAGIPANRMALARWIVSKQNPLSARVQVNRMWEMIFGRGIVESVEDFGTQGARPSHPQLLDWLAVEFMKRNWDMKAMLKLIVTSATYRQTSAATKKLMELDPENVLLARGPRYRMEAEMIRDNALAASGLLNKKIGGPSVFPYQPDGIWNSPYSGERWMTSEGAELYRRSLYTFWKRTAPYPAFVAFDATSRETCTVRRMRTNTPLQALALLNDDAMIEAAKALAKLMIQAGPAKAARIQEGFIRCTGRKPSSAEIERVSKLADSLRLQYEKNPEAAKKLGGDKETSTWTMVANVLLNLDETITRT